jgi:AraC family transcriptional regulator
MAITLSFKAAGYPAGTQHRPHSHDALHLSLVLTGRIAETVGSVTEYARALSVVAKDAGVVHADHFGREDARLAQLSLQAGSIGRLVDDPSRSSSWRWTHDVRVANPFLRLVHRAKAGMLAFDNDDPDVLDLLAAFTARPAPPTHGEPPAWLKATMLELRSSWRPGLSVADVARSAGVHPVYLARCTRRWFGTGVGEEIRRARIRSAAAAIADSDTTVSRIAHGGGFADEPHLCREFRRTVGVTPRHYRNLVRELRYAWRGPLESAP